MTESLVDQIIAPSYEQLRDELRHKEAKDLWREADLRVRHTRESMQAIHDDVNLSDEGKREAAQRLIDSSALKAQESYATARTKLESSAESSWRFSVPFPDNKTLATTSVEDSNELIAIQNESAALAQRIESKSLQEMTRGRAKNPRAKGIQASRDHKMETLKAEYSQALEQGGFEGKIRAHAVMRYCDQNGVDFERVVDGFRRDVHHRAYQDAAHYERALAVVPSGQRVTVNPYDDRNSRRGAKAVGAYRGQNTALGSSGTSQLFQKKRRKPAWK